MGYTLFRHEKGENEAKNRVEQIVLLVDRLENIFRDKREFYKNIEPAVQQLVLISLSFSNFQVSFSYFYPFLYTSQASRL